jgi:hypothetical protein
MILISASETFRGAFCELQFSKQEGSVRNFELTDYGDSRYWLRCIVRSG